MTTSSTKTWESKRTEETRRIEARSGIGFRSGRLAQEVQFLWRGRGMLAEAMSLASDCSRQGEMRW